MPAPADFRISSFCQGGGCVGVALGPDRIAVRSTQVPGGPVLSFAAPTWRGFLTGVRVVERREPDRR